MIISLKHCQKFNTDSDFGINILLLTYLKDEHQKEFVSYSLFMKVKSCSRKHVRSYGIILKTDPRYAHATGMSQLKIQKLTTAI